MISIIVPIYNVEKYLRPCLNSILNQSFTDYELILVNDGSTDKSGRICDEFAQLDRRISVIHKTNGGLSDARNFGLGRAKGDFISFIDSDDVVHPSMLQVLYDSLLSGDYDLSMIYGRMVPDGFDVSSLKSIKIDSLPSVVLDKHTLMKRLYGRGESRTWFQVVWSKLYRRKCLDGLFFKNTMSEDAEYNNRVYLRVKNAVLIESELYYWVQRPSSITHSQFNERNIDLINSYELCLSEIPESDKISRTYCIDSFFRSLLTLRYNSRNTPYQKQTNEEIKDTFRRYKGAFIKSKNSLFQIGIVFIMYYLPGIHVAIMKGFEILAIIRK